MSCYLVSTLPRHLVLVADNRRRVLGKLGRKAFRRPLFIDDARKLLPISPFFWITGIGLSEFAPRVASDIRARFEDIGPKDYGDSWRDHWQLIPSQRELSEIYHALLLQALDLAETIGGSPIRPDEITTDIVFAAFSSNRKPFLARASSNDQFKVETYRGPGHTLISPFGPGNPSPFEDSIKDWIETEMLQIHDGEEEEIIRSCLELFPAIMKRISSRFPERISPNGDLVVVGPGGRKWVLF